MLPEELLSLVWGPVIKQELFLRWSQGFIFSSCEKSALIQSSGGPCAVIAPVQAFMIKNLLNIYQIQHIRELEEEIIDKYLSLSLVELLCQSRLDINENSSFNCSLSKGSVSANECNGPFTLVCLDDPLSFSKDGEFLDDSSIASHHSKEHELFHSSVRLKQFESKHALEEHLEFNLSKFKIRYGILLFLYSVILTRGIERVMGDLGESEESLIDQMEGHGGQSLINLLITGKASSYVWDGDKDVDGLRLSGVLRRPKVGFLTHMEHLNYVQVGWYFKNPLSPIWVLGSGTHLTVFFSWAQTLITPDTDYERAKKVLSWFDTDGNKFFTKTKLKEVLSELSLCTEDDFVDFMSKELDPENMGVILFNKFLETFYDVNLTYRPPDTFEAFHYNGLEASCPNHKVCYAEGIITLQDDRIQYSNQGSNVLSCLRTKWGSVDAVWKNFVPLLN